MQRPNDDSSTGSKASTSTRRRYLAALATVGSVAIAGCSGDGGGDDSSDGGGSPSSEAAASGSGQETAASGSGSGGETGGGEVPEFCPSPPYDYEQRPVPAGSNREDSGVTVGVPTGADEIHSGISAITVDFQRGSIAVMADYRPDASVETEFNTANGYSEVTAEYDLPSGARATRRRRNATRGSVRVFLPVGSDTVIVRVENTNQEACEGPMVTVRDAMVDSVSQA